jgi:hypothetical protein
MLLNVQKVSLARRFALVPLGPPLLAYSSNCKAMLTAVDGAVELVVDRPYKAGEPIVVWYVNCFDGLNFILFCRTRFFSLRNLKFAFSGVGHSQIQNCF